MNNNTNMACFAWNFCISSQQVRNLRTGTESLKQCINGLHFSICEVASKMNSKVRSSFDCHKGKLQSVIYSSYYKYYNIKKCVCTSLLIFKSLHEDV